MLCRSYGALVFFSCHCYKHRAPLGLIAINVPPPSGADHTSLVHLDTLLAGWDTKRVDAVPSAVRFVNERTRAVNSPAESTRYRTRAGTHAVHASIGRTRAANFVSRLDTSGTPLDTGRTHAGVPVAGFPNVVTDSLAGTVGTPAAARQVGNGVPDSPARRAKLSARVGPMAA